VRTRAVLCLAFALFGALLSWPLLTIANRTDLVLGIPSLVAYLFAVWVALIVVLFVVTRRRDEAESG
jgi:apolipoprotein N-acyltransferase